jgi:hypothetical protein
MLFPFYCVSIDYSWARDASLDVTDAQHVAKQGPNDSFSILTKLLVKEKVNKYINKYIHE